MSYILIEDNEKGIVLINPNFIKEIRIGKIHSEPDEWTINLYDSKYGGYEIDKVFKSKSEAYEYLQKLFDLQHVEVINALDMSKTKKGGQDG